MKNIYVHALASHFNHAKKTKNVQNWPYFNRNYLEGQLVHIGLFGFSDSIT